MTKDEILEELEAKHIILQITPGKYTLTEKYKELLLEKPTIRLEPLVPSTDLNLKTLMNTSSNGHEWPIQITGSQGHSRASNFCDLCEVPRFAPKGYPLRGMSKEAINILGNIIVDSTICPTTFIDSIKTYYKYCDMPKGVKALLIEGTAFEIYKEHIEGKLVGSLTGNSENKTNQTWQ